MIVIVILSAAKEPKRGSASDEARVGGARRLAYVLANLPRPHYL